MTTRERANELLKSITLTSDDVKRFEPLGSFGQQLLPSLGKTVCLIDHDVRTIQGRHGDLLFTVLKFSQEDDEALRSKCTVTFDFQNIFVSANPDTSLQKIGEGNGGEDALALLGSFIVDKIEPTGFYPMKYSAAAQELGFLIGHTYTDTDWAPLRTKYKSDDKWKKTRTDNSDDISWLEIQHIFITPRA